MSNLKINNMSLMKPSLLIFGVLLIVCFGCKNKPKDQNGSNIPDLDHLPAKMHTVIDEDFLFKQAMMDYDKVGLLKGFKRVDHIYPLSDPYEGKVSDTVTLFYNQLDSIEFYHNGKEKMTLKYILRSKLPTLLDTSFNIGADRANFKDRFPYVKDNDTVEITTREGMCYFRAILRSGKVQKIQFRNDFD